jgi:hypothetical protein
MIGLLAMIGAAALCLIGVWRRTGIWRATYVALALWCVAIVAVVFHRMPLSIATWFAGIAGVIVALNAIKKLAGSPDPTTGREN